jgi:hypothetical protein
MVLMQRKKLERGDRKTTEIAALQFVYDLVEVTSGSGVALRESQGVHFVDEQPIPSPGLPRTALDGNHLTNGDLLS